MVASAADEGTSGPSGLPGNRCEPCQACSLLAVRLSKLRHFNEKGESGDFGNAWNALQDRKTFRKLCVFGDADGDFFLNGSDLSRDLLAMLSIVLFQKRQTEGFAAVPCRRAICNSLSSLCI